MSELNFASLQIVGSDEFIEEIKHCNKSLKKNQAKRFFQEILGLLGTDSLDKEFAKFILHGLFRTLRNYVFLDIFVEEKFIHFLPYRRKCLHEEILNIFYLIVHNSPQAFDELVAQNFSHIIRHRGYKSLCILYLYSHQFLLVSNPFPILDLLFSEKNRFSAPDTSIKYMILLSQLVQSYIQFRNKYSHQVWNIFNQFLNNDNPEIVCVAYDEMAGICSVDQSNKIPFKTIQSHLATVFNGPITNIHISILHLLFMAPFNPDEILCLIQPLLEISKKNNTATLYLMRVAVNPMIASKLASNFSWLNEELPNKIETLRLFLVVFRHQFIKNEILRINIDKNFKFYKTPPNSSKKINAHKNPSHVSQNFIAFTNFLSSLMEIPNSAIYTTITLIIKGIQKQLHETNILYLSQSGFLKTFFKKVPQNVAIFMANIISHITYVPELLSVCDLILKLGEKNLKLYEMCTKTAIQLCHYKQCKNHFLKLEAYQIYEKHYEKDSNDQYTEAMLYILEDSKENDTEMEPQFGTFNESSPIDYQSHSST